MKEKVPREKKWKHLYTRSVKLQRARQLGLDYPVKTQRQKLESESINILFVCSMNRWRSPTAESIYKEKPLINARSAGTSSRARHHVTLDDIKWADLIIVMEAKHKRRLMADHPEAMRYRELHVLGIEDNYKFMDPELISVLHERIDPLLESKR